MSKDEILEAALALSWDDQVLIAHALWDNVHREIEAAPVDEETLAILRQRAADFESGAVVGIPHEEVMAAARRAIAEEQELQ